MVNGILFSYFFNYSQIMIYLYFFKILYLDCGKIHNFVSLIFVNSLIPFPALLMSYCAIVMRVGIIAN